MGAPEGLVTVFEGDDDDRCLIRGIGVCAKLLLGMQNPVNKTASPMSDVGSSFLPPYNPLKPIKEGLSVFVFEYVFLSLPLEIPDRRILIVNIYLFMQLCCGLQFIN